MKRKLPLLFLILCSYLAGSAHADFATLVLDKTKQMEQELSFSPEFMEHIKNCTPAEENKKSDNLDLDVKYIIEGIDETGKCKVSNISKANGLVIKTNCRFDDITRQIWYKAQNNLKRLFKTATSIQDIFSSDDYWTAAGIFSDKENCTIFNQEFDPGKELREHLKNCTPFNQKEYIKISRTDIEYTISGEQDGKCLFQQKITQRAPSAEDTQKLFGPENHAKIKDMLQDITIVTNCRFSEAVKNKYISLLSQTAVPAGTITDIEQMNIDPQPFSNAINFLSATPQCQTEIPNIRQKF